MTTKEDRASWPEIKAMMVSANEKNNYLNTGLSETFQLGTALGVSVFKVSPARLKICLLGGNNVLQLKVYTFLFDEHFGHGPNVSTNRERH